MLGHMKKSLVLVAVATSAGLLPGVHSLSLSQGCESAVEGLLTSPDAACLNPSALLSFVLGSDAGSIPSTVNSWLTGICSTGSCTNDSISSVVTNVASACSSELSSLGISTYRRPRRYCILCKMSTLPFVKLLACKSESWTNSFAVLGTYPFLYQSATQPASCA
ncbi:hypothetical protein BT96DRAFT_8537 [Gymnopus androsaceus JB14]|uniref:Uncharacterized protein n=1 Tax=Gymnopus androsaceus JB14 TaxID=1447944 RepID=A0A6A4INL8_9AGAR|nr:hypothetical protein BT96DRAFT_8537 [Gymnopus androsaceus JB14]